MRTPVEPSCPVLSLSCHGEYACRHAGACCSSGWTIPIEHPLFDRLTREQADGRLLPVTSAGGDSLLGFPEPTPDYAGLLGQDARGYCAFFLDDRRQGGSCAIERTLGHDALPHACQQFPRVAVMRPGSIAVSLSHYCPTAASLTLGGASAVTVEKNHPSFAWRLLEGLDMRMGLPPLLRPDALFSWTAYERWERHVLAAVANEAGTIEDSIAGLADLADRMRTWSMAAGDFDDWVDRCLEDSPSQGHPLARAPDPDAVRAAHGLVSSAVPPAVVGLPPLPDITPGWDGVMEGVASRQGPVRRFLAAHTWASWVMHEGRGVRSAVGWVRLTYHLLLGAASQTIAAPTAGSVDRWLCDAMRQTDLWLVHLASPRALAACLAPLED